MKKIISVLLVLLMIAAVTVACDDTGDTSSTPTQSTESTVASNTESDDGTSSDEDDTCPLPAKQWNTTLTWLTENPEGRTDDVRYYQIWCDEQLGDNISKAAYERSQWLKSDFGIEFEVRVVPNGTSVIKNLEAAMATNDTIHAVTDSVYQLAQQIASGRFYDVREINEKYNGGKGWIDFTAPYWDSNAIEAYSINHKAYLLTGDALLQDDASTWAMFFNMDMVDEYKFENPYETVENGEWTIDRLYEYCQEVTKPTGDKLTWLPEDHNKWGLVCQTYDSLMFALGAGQQMVTKNEADLPVINMNSQRFVDVIQNMVAILGDDDVIGIAEHYDSKVSEPNVKIRQIFANGDAMFMPGSMLVLDNDIVKSAEFSIGVLPMPKADSLQDDYSSSSNVYSMHMIAVPICNTGADLEATLYALEVMSWYGRRYIKPEYYERVLKLQKFDDDRADDVLDLVFANKTYDISIAYNWANIIQFYNALIYNRSTDVVSERDKKISQLQTAIDLTIAKFKE